MELDVPGNPDFDLATEVDRLHMEAMKLGFPIDIQKVAGMFRAVREEVEERCEEYYTADHS